MEIDDSRSKPVEERIENALVKVTFIFFIEIKCLLINTVIVIGY